MIQILLSFMIMLAAHAEKPECFRFEFEGKVKTLAGRFVVITHEGTRSQKVFEFDHQDIPKLAPYAGKFARGEFILSDENPVSGTKVLSLTKIDFGIPDPLQVVRGLQKLGKSLCSMP